MVELGHHPMTTTFILAPTRQQATAYGKTQGWPARDTRHLTERWQLLGIVGAEVHVLPEANPSTVRGFDALIREAEQRQATVLYPEEA